MEQAALPSSIAEKTLARDKQCVFTGVSPTCDPDTLVATWIFPPFLGYTLAEDPWVERTYHDDPASCDLSEFMVVTNTISGCRDVVALFYENKLGVDVDENYRIVVFDGSENMKCRAPLKSHLTFVNGHNRPSDRFLRLHFQRCLTVSVCGGNPTEDYKDQEIDLFMEELGVYDDEMDTTDPRWMTPLGIEVYTYLIRQKLAE
ncbi:hypothetical protein BYT27DRAFT_7123584 [Phlegmacium glaucopus]|nr:hypothetical protein BYT27DRAFT_7123584 [Phlegmacium glaucopus]